MYEQTESAPHPTWPHLETVCTVRIYEHHGTKPHRYLVEGYIGFADPARSQWSVTDLLDTLAEAEERARLWWSVALPLWRRSVETGAYVETPGRRLAIACERHVAALPEVAEAAEAVRRTAAARKAHGYAPGWQALRQAENAAQDIAEARRWAAERAFCAAHSWVEFITPTAAPGRGQLALLKGAAP